MATTARTSTPGKPSARQRAGQPPATPGRKPAAATVTSLGDSGLTVPELQAQIAEMQQTMEAMARQQQTAAAQRALPPPPAPPQADAGPLNWRGIEPLRLSSDATIEDTGRHPLFYIDDRAYTVPNEVSSAVGLQYIHLSAGGDIGVLQAQDYLLNELLGADAYRALREYQALTSAHLAWVIEACSRLALGTIEVPKG